MERINKLIEILEDKGYVKVKINSEWSYKYIKCEEKSVENKIKEIIKEENINEKDYFFHYETKTIYIFNTRNFVEQFDKIIMKQKEEKYFDWYDFGDVYDKYRTLDKLLENYGYRFEYPHRSSYCHCINTKKQAERLLAKKRRKEEIDNFIENLEL